MSATCRAPTAYIPFLSAGLILPRRGTGSEQAKSESARTNALELTVICHQLTKDFNSLQYDGRVARKVCCRVS